MLCSVVKHAEAARARKKCSGKHEPIGECFSLLLERSSRFLSALQQNRAQSRLLYLFYDKEQVIFFKNSTLFSKRALLVANCGVVSTVLYTLIKHANLDQSEHL